MNLPRIRVRFRNPDSNQVQLLVDQPATLNLTMNVAASETTIAVQAHVDP